MQKSVVFLLVLCAGLFAFAQPAHGATVRYQLPVHASIKETFNAPGNPYAPGNRGIDFSVHPGQTVVAAASGTATFAGSIGNNKYVAIRHADGISTTYSYLSSISVHRGTSVPAGTRIGTTTSRFHWGARVGKAYVDPAYLLDAQPARAYLVKDEQQLNAASLHTSRVSNSILSWLRQTDELNCTPVTNALPPKLSDRHIAVLVGGLGSRTDGSSLFLTDYTMFGYAAGDIKQFSYNGGETRANPYVGEDTNKDLELVANRLVSYVRQLHKQYPSVQIDLFAHSLGGVVVHDAISRLSNVGVSQVVTIDSPHSGADLATGGSLLDDLEHTTNAYPAINQLKPASAFIERLQKQKIPKSVSVLSIGSDIDPVVTANRTFWKGATNVVVSPRGRGNPHSFVAGDRSTQREIGLALNGMLPTCGTVRSTAARYGKGGAISAVERRLARLAP